AAAAYKADLTFGAIWTEDGPYDWEAELDETIAHELEHHEGWRVGHDPMDEEEQREIAAEHALTAGHKTVARAAARAFAADVAEFLTRTWVLWALIAAATGCAATRRGEWRRTLRARVRLTRRRNGTAAWRRRTRCSSRPTASARHSVRS